MSIALIVNGKQEDVEVPGGASLSQVIAAMELQSDRVAVEHNGGIVARAAWATQTIAPGDKLEIVHFVGGGSSSRPLWADCT